MTILNSAVQKLQQQSPPYIDRKRWAWLISVIGPAISLVGTVSVSALNVGTWVLFFPLVFFYALVPLLDFVIGEDTSNPPESSIAALEADPSLADNLRGSKVQRCRATTDVIRSPW